MSVTGPRAKADSETGDLRWLPDFCSLPVVFAVMVVAELLVLVIVIAPTDESLPLLPRLATASAFVQWLGLVCVVCLCQLQPALLRLAPVWAITAAYVLVLAITLLGSALVFALDHQFNLGMTLPFDLQARFLSRNVLLAALVGAALLRYFYVLEQWRARVRAEGKARFEALQARIRPHFLFNSMNTIISLIRSRPTEAENAVENLSDLFRAALGADNAPSTLGTELELVRHYLDIEQLRLGDRLRVEFDVADLPADLEVPALLLQPLIENAVYHGVEQVTDGTITIRGSRTDGLIRIDIRNPRPPAGARGPGRHGVALANTRSRIEYHFGRHAALDIDAGADYFSCSVRLPVEGGEGRGERGEGKKKRGAGKAQ
jgi:two-component system sensor histidine kinase AlgZ